MKPAQAQPKPERDSKQDAQQHKEQESARLSALQALQVLDSPPEPEFDALVQAAALACAVPIARIGLVDEQRVWFKAGVGLEGLDELPRHEAFCALTILQDDIFEVEDASHDERFRQLPAIAGPVGLRFYAGAALRLSGGQIVGTLCVLDVQPRKLNQAQRDVLLHLAQAVVHALELRRSALAERQAANALAERNAWFQTLNEAAPIGIFHSNTSGACSYTNPRWQEIFGLAAEQVLGQGWSQTIHPQDRARVVEHWLSCARSQREFEMEFRVHAAGSGLRHVHVRSRPVLGAAGEFIGHVGAVEDITERIRSQAELAASQARLSMALDSGRIGIWELDLHSGQLVWDDWMHRLYGLEPSGKPMTYSAWAACLHPDDLRRAEHEVQQAIKGLKPFDTEFRVVWPDASVHHLRGSARLMFDEQGRALRMVGANWDLTQIRQLAEEMAARMGSVLAEQHELLLVTLRSIGDAVITVDSSSQVVWLNPAAEQLTGWAAEEARGRPLEQVYHIVNEQSRMPVENPVLACLKEGRKIAQSAPILLISRTGEEYGVQDSVAPIRNDQGAIFGVVLVFHDVTEQRRLSGEMTYRATHDALTGLINRSEFELRLRRVLEQAQGDRSQHALLYIDLDQFKLVNDACGHAVGDQLLKQVAGILAAAVRNRDTLARLGGDEFAALLEHCSPAQAQRVAQQICDRMEEFRFAHEERRYRIGASIGLVPISGRWPSAAAILQAADTSCYAAKEQGRNRVHTWFDTDLAMRARHGEMQWTGRIEQALDEDRFVLYAQRIEALHLAPVASTAQASALPVLPAAGLHAEILLRMVEPSGALVLPGVFLPAAERFNLATRIDRWVLRHVLDWMAAEPELAAIKMLSVNLSGQSIGDRAFHRWAIAALTEAGPALCGRLCIEITETAAITSLADAVLFIEQVRALGVRGALDDFGAGASSFGYLKHLPVDYLKIDGQFVRDLVNDALDEAAVRCFVDVAQVVGMQTVAEYVDSPAVLARLREIGVNFSQGFLQHEPMPLSELIGSRLNALPQPA
ncbi:EAL domain-containing protein [Paucibacter sp. TC2R-5]|uniref:EAL domain-containing protein n=1 Tax=Paucibacter sp. TC2R-5 TaxID=2893555 RepID=UPI0021E4323E|nr:EAL domain-containing protein [Paucibacter sp. TC2R-5]MCV2359387.1 EAL domain-containing protein [Paucibacter sp. TC2R-5]